MKTRQTVPQLLGVFLSLLIGLSTVHADDTEIFFGQSDDAFNTNPNILFILDTSGSMTELDGGSLTRMQRLKQAMGLILDQSSSYNVGLMGFSGQDQGGSIRYPVGYLESDSTEYCPDEGCPDEMVIARPGSANHDVMENDVTGVVELNQQTLVMTEVADAAAPPVDPDAATPDSTIEIFSSQDYNEGHVSVDDSTIPKYNMATGDWFHNDTADTVRHAYFFPDIVIPADATITSSYIEFQHTGVADQVGTLGTFILAEATGAPANYELITEPGWTPLFQRVDPINTASNTVSWGDIPPNATFPAADGTVQTPDLTAMIQEVSSLPSWPAAGGDLSIIFDPHDSVVNDPLTHRRSFYGSVAEESLRPKLIINYSQPETPNTITRTESFTASAHADQITEDVSGYMAVNETNVASRLFHAGTENLPRKLALRFDNLDVPKDATITSATLTINSDPTAVEDIKSDWTAYTDDLQGSASAPPPAAGPFSLTMNISAEKGIALADFSTVDLDAREYTTSFVAWENVPTTTTGELTSPELTSVVSEIIDQTEWVSGSDLSLLLSAPSTYDNVPENSFLALTSTSTATPTLNLTWEEPDTVAGPEPVAHTTGLRFTNVHVPPGAQVKSAYLSFTSAAAGTEATALDISAEDEGNPAAFSTTDHDLSSRIQTTAREVWTVPAFETVGAAHDSTDITSIVQELVARTDWCGGNPMHFFLSGTGVREVVSYDQNPVLAPALHITYEPASVPAGNYCSNSAIVVSVTDDADDATESVADGTMSIDGHQLKANTLPNGNGAQNLIGVRFRGLQVPNGAVVVSASLELTVDSDVDAAETFTISVENEDSANQFYSTANNISARNYLGTTENWTLQPLAAGEGAFTSDITPLVKSIVDRTGWASGNNIAFKLAPVSTSSTTSFSSISAGETVSARLVVYFQDLRDQPGTLFRENLKNQVNALVAQDGTPIVEAYYEAAQYFTNGTLDYGLRRGVGGYWDRYHRVSHPFSYENGIVSRDGTCEDSNLDNPDCQTEQIYPAGATAPTYTSPIEGQCQTNHIVVLTDGEPTSNNAIAKIQAKIGAAACTGANTNERCGRELANWLATTDLNPSLPGDQTVKTHTIGFNLAEPKFLEDLATEGLGGAYSASSSAQLLQAFKNIFVNVSKLDTSFVAPSATINQFNRLKNREDVYFSLFKPDSTSRWAGNVKRYKLHAEEGEHATIVDVNDDPAVNESTGEFKETSRSFWSSVTDGSSVVLGGAAEQIEHNGVSHLNRKVYTYTGTNPLLNQIENELLPFNTAIDVEWFDLPPIKETDTDYVTDLINWAHGQDINDFDGDGDTQESRGEMGDPMHSRPLLMNYSGGKSVLYVATNEGYLHAFDHATGEEEFAFIPKELLKNLDAFYNNAPTLSRPYGLDGGITTWTDDTNKNGVIDSNEKAYMVIGMRRGGNHYFALDVSDYNNPKYLWSIDGSTTTIDTNQRTADGDFEELGQTWSKPVKTKVMDYNTEREVLIFGAGYDPNQDPPANADPADGVPRSQDGIGRGLFIVDALTGEEIWQTNRNDHNDMNYSMPSEVRVIDMNFDGLADQLYIGDMGGQVWRFDINNDASSGDSLLNRITGDVVAQLGGDAAIDARKFYYPPDVSVVSTAGRQQLAISIGSGWRAHPLDKHINDRFYSFRMDQVFGAPVDDYGDVEYPPAVTENDLVDVTGSINNVVNGINTDKGWRISLGTDGEKVLTSSVTVDNQVLFTSYQPATEASACSAAVGSGALYALHLRNGDPVVDFDESGGDVLTSSDRKDELDHAGIPPDTTVLFPTAGDATVVVGAETVDEIDIGSLRRRSFWVEVLEE